MKKIRKYPNSIDGRFSHASPNANIRLSREEVTLNFQDGRKISTKGILYLELMPSFNFAIKVNLSYDSKNPLSLLFEFNDIDLKINRA
jgi:hypothetical protein